MAIFLISVLVLLLAGAFVTYFLSSRSGKEATIGATAVLAIVLLVWLLAKRALPLSLVLANWSPVETASPWLLLVDEINWQISFYFLLFLGALLLTQSRFNVPQRNNAQSFGERIYLPLTLLATAVVLLAVWSSSFFGLISSWALLAILWLVILWANQRTEADPKDLIRRFGLLLLSVAFLGLAAATTDRPSELLTGENWPTTSLLLAYLAVLTQLGAIPLQWWRPLSWPLSPSASALIHLLPAVTGTALLARLALIVDSQAVIATIITPLGWLGLFFGAYLAWIHVKRPALAVTGLAIAQLGLIGIAGVWADSASVVATYRVLILAVGCLYLINGLPKQRFPWYIVVPIAALAGFPLTAGFSGLASLYSGWFSSGRLGLAIVTGLLIVPVIAAAIQVALQATADDQEADLTRGDRILLNAGLLLPTLGLLALPGSYLIEVPLVTWILVLASIGASIVLSRNGELLRLRLIQFTQGLNMEEIEDRAGTILAKLTNGLSLAIRETAGILEGEGGMLWLLVLAIIIWLARRG